MRIAVCRPQVVFVRGGAEIFTDRLVVELRARGHDVEVAAPWSLGRVSAVGREPDGLLKAAANPRAMQGYAVGR